MRVVGAHVNAPVPTEILGTDPNVGLDVLNEVPDVDRSVGVRKSAGYEDFSHEEFLLSELETN